ncbi:hypothetical protein Tco_1323892 [Tanacetum coccineum]
MSIRNDLKLDDAKGTNCLPIATIFEELERMGGKTTAWKEFSSTMASAIICLATNQKFSISKYIFDNMEKVLDLEKAMTSQAKEIASLKKRVKQLEKRRHSRTLRLKRLRKVRSASSVESLNDVSLGAPKDTSKQGRKIADLNANAEVTLINETQEINDGDLMFDIDILDDDKVFEEPMAFAATTTRLVPVTTTTSVEIPDELTLAQTLIEIKSTKTKAVTTDATTVTHVFTRPKVKGTVFHDQDEQAPASKPIISPAQPTSKDKEQAKLERMQRERVEQEEASRAAIIKELDSIQAMVEVDEQLDARLQAKEQE